MFPLTIIGRSFVVTHCDTSILPMNIAVYMSQFITDCLLIMSYPFSFLFFVFCLSKKRGLEVPKKKKEKRARGSKMKTRKQLSRE